MAIRNPCANQLNSFKSMSYKTSRRVDFLDRGFDHGLPSQNQRLPKKAKGPDDLTEATTPAGNSQPTWALILRDITYFDAPGAVLPAPTFQTCLTHYLTDT
jgi:hypothetical protein